jgi:hypothetical protein
MNAAPHRTRCRRLYAAWIVVVVCAGLASRSEAVGLPLFLAKYGADALWALMIFLCVGFVLARWSTGAVAVVATAISCAVEFSQLYHTPWLDAIRNTALGRLTLGDTFAWCDIAAYLVGIAVGSGIEWTTTFVRARL